MTGRQCKRGTGGLADLAIIDPFLQFAADKFGVLAAHEAEAKHTVQLNKTIDGQPGVAGAPAHETGVITCRPDLITQRIVALMLKYAIAPMPLQCRMAMHTCHILPALQIAVRCKQGRQSRNIAIFDRALEVFKPRPGFLLTHRMFNVHFALTPHVRGRNPDIFTRGL